MNTVIKFDLAHLVHSPALKQAKVRGVAWVISPSTLHPEGEVYDIGTSTNVKSSSIILPRWQLEEFSELVDLGYYIYFIRCSAVGLGSLSLEIGKEMEPVLVPTHATLEKFRAKSQQKHVSKPDPNQ